MREKEQCVAKEKKTIEILDKSNTYERMKISQNINQLRKNKWNDFVSNNYSQISQWFS